LIKCTADTGSLFYRRRLGRLNKETQTMLWFSSVKMFLTHRNMNVVD